MSRRKLSKAEAGRLGGAATVERHGPEHMRQIGALGGAATVERHGPEHMARIGARGFRAYAEAHHNGCAERAVFALRKAGRPGTEQWKQAALPAAEPSGRTSMCWCDAGTRPNGRCRACGCWPVSFEKGA